MKFIITEEQSEKLNHRVKSMVNKYGVRETLRLFDDNKEIVKHAYQDNPLEYLKQFDDLTPVDKGNIMYYVDKNGLPLFAYFKNRNSVYINYEKIWSFFSMVIGLNSNDIEGIIKDWMEETYNLKGLTPKRANQHLFRNL